MKKKTNREQIKNLSIGAGIISGSIILIVMIVWFFCFLGKIYGNWSYKMATEQSEITSLSIAKQEVIQAQAKAEANRIIRGSLGSKYSFISYLKVTTPHK